MDKSILHVVHDSAKDLREAGTMKETTLREWDALCSRITGVTEKASLVREGLKALIERESARRLSKFGATEPDLKSIPRRRAGHR